jgi:putative oxidoreductase
MIRNVAVLGSRLVVGSYLAIHGAQKLFGAFEGPGLEAAGGFFEKIGLTPGREMAILASSSELAGGVLTATGIAYPVGPLMIVGTMAVASLTHRANGPLAIKNGFEHPLTNAAAAAALAAAGPGSLSVGPPAPKPAVWLSAVVGAGLAGYSISKLLRAEQTQSGSTDQGDQAAAAAPISDEGDQAAAVAQT